MPYNYVYIDTPVQVFVFFQDVYVIQCVKNDATHVMKKRVEQIAASNKNVKDFALYSSDDSSKLKNIQGCKGNLTAEKLKQIVPTCDAEFYFCGSPKFLEAVREMLIELNVPQAQIHYEFFGPNEIL